MLPSTLPSHTLCYRVYYKDTDAGGVLYYGRYADILEMGRTELFREASIDFKDLTEKQGLIIPVIHYRIDYKKPAFYNDLLLLETRLLELSKLTIKHGYTLFCKKAAKDSTNKLVLLAKAVTVNVCVDIETQRPRRLPNDIVEKFRPL